MLKAQPWAGQNWVTGGGCEAGAGWETTGLNGVWRTGGRREEVRGRGWAD